MTDHAIAWVRQQKALMPDKPFFVYFAPGATHAPHHVPQEWIDKYHGQFDDGWDALRERTFARQKELGVIPQDAQLTPRPAEIPAWDEMPEELKPILRREMEVYAAFLEHTDFHVGRLIDALADLGVLDDTLVYYIIGDNGASAEGTLNGCFNECDLAERRSRDRDAGVPDQQDRRLRRAGGLQPLRGGLGARHGHALPVDQAGRLPLGRHPQRHDRPLAELASTPRARCATSSTTSSTSPRRCWRRPSCRTRPSSTASSRRRWRASAWPTRFDDADAAERHTTQYFEMFGNRGLYHQGWTAVTKHSLPWVSAELPAFDDDVWELYGPDDWTQAQNLAAENPEQLAHLQRLWLIEATKYHVLPLDDRRFERFNPDLAGRPTLIHGNTQTPLRRHGAAERERGRSTSRTSRTRSPPSSSYRNPAPTA